MSQVSTFKTAGAVVLSASLLLTGCANVPDFRMGERISNPFRRAAPSGAMTPAAPDTPAASAAETACMEAGRLAGFDVRGVIGTREVIGTGGLPQSRDVMLQVDRSGQSVEVRCSFGYLDGQARIMTL